jgi:hypothetical protein
LIGNENDYLIFRFGSKIVEQNIENKNAKQLNDVNSLFFFSYTKWTYFILGRREALDKSQRTDGESTATGSSTPSANSSSSLSSVSQETSTNVDHSLSTSHHSAVCSTIPSNNSNSSRSDISPGIQSTHSPNYCPQPLALTTNGRLNNNYRKDMFSINHIAQHLLTTSNNNIGPYIKL